MIRRLSLALCLVPLLLSAGPKKTSGSAHG